MVLHKIAKLRRFNSPAVPLRQRAFERAGRVISPFSGIRTRIPVPEEGSEFFEQKYAEWRQIFNGSKPEFIVWEFLTLRKKQRNQIDFFFQHPLLGGRTRFGGFILDFFFPVRREAWRIQGERFHLLRAKDRAKDSISRVIISGRGLKVIDLWEIDLLTRPNFVLDLAWDRSTGVLGRRFRD